MENNRKTVSDLYGTREERLARYRRQLAVLREYGQENEPLGVMLRGAIKRLEK